MTSYCTMYVMAQFCHYSTQDLTESIASLGMTQATSKKENETINFLRRKNLLNNNNRSNLIPGKKYFNQGWF